MRLALFTIDPGGSTGVSWGIYDLQSDTVVDAMRNREESGSATITAGRIEKMKGGPFQAAIRKQTDQVMKLWDQFVSVYMKHHDMDGPTEIELEFVMEHFVLTTARHKPGIEGIFPAFLIGSIIEAADGEQIVMQTASQGMKWNQRDHLTRYNAWIRGREHERAAFAHAAARLHTRLT